MVIARRFLTSLMEVVGCAVVVYGIATVCIPAALIVGGGALVAFGVLLS